MADSIRGDLVRQSVSLQDIEKFYHNIAEKTADFVYDKVFDKGIDLLGEGLPDDLKTNVGESVKALAVTYMPGTSQKLAEFITKTSSSLAMLGKDAARILLAAESMGIDPGIEGLRLVNPKLSVEEARRYYKWSGILFEARPSYFHTGSADPKAYFTIYVPSTMFVPGKKHSPKSTFRMTITNAFYR